MGAGMLAPAFLAGLAAIAIPVLIHMIHRERRETLAFPSLMFLRKIPYRSVRRQKLRHLALLALRCLAIAIVVSAFARPFFERPLPVMPATSDAREIVLVLDRSYSMGYGSRWARATAAALTVARDARRNDRVSVVTFGSTAAQLSEPTNDATRIARAIAPLRPGSEPTRVSAGLRLAAQLLASSNLPRKEIVLISDFHRFGWTPSDETPLPAGTVVRTVDVSRHEQSDVAVVHVAIARTRVRDRSQATVTARLTNLGADPRAVDVSLELAGRRVQTRRLTLPARGAAQAVFSPAPVADVPVRGVVRVTPDSQPANDAFYFVTADASGASVLVIQPNQARQNQSLYLTRAWSVADDPPVRVDVKDAAAVSATDLRDRSLVVLNEVDVTTLPVGDLLLPFVTQGGLLFVAPGDLPATSWPAALRARFPASIGEVVERNDGASWTSVDDNNPLFEAFRAPGMNDFANVQATRYRALTPAPDSAQVIARLDDGAPLLVERAVGGNGGSGRIMLWATSLDARWTDLPFHPVWVPLLHQLAHRSLAGRESPAWVTVPRTLDLAREGSRIVESPSGLRSRVPDAAGATTIDLREQGFYEIRGATTALGAGRPVAANVELAESDLSHFDPAELVAALTAAARQGATAQTSGSQLAGTAQDAERSQSIWWYLLVAAAAILAAETLFGNRLSRGAAPVRAAMERAVR